METLLPERIYQRLKQGLFAGEFRPGVRLDYRRLADELGVSTTPLREAMAKLASEGLVHLVPRAGAVVNTLDRDELVQLYGVREAIETHAIILAAKQISSASLEHLEVLVEEMDQLIVRVALSPRVASPPDPVAEFLRFDFAFHMVIVSAGNNPRLTKIAGECLAQARMFVAERTGADPSLLREVNRQHEALLETLRRGDATGARDLMSQHIRHSLKLRQEQDDLIPADPWWSLGSLAGSADGQLTFQG